MQDSKVIFIPKPGKTDYSTVKSFRPISLTSFAFKATEKVLLWDLENQEMYGKINKNQHVFCNGHSRDTALTVMVGSIENAALNDQHALGIFLDISGTFDKQMQQQEQCIRKACQKL